MGSKRYPFIVFDMDGLLVDTERVYYEGWLDAFQKNGLNIPSSVAYSWAGKSVEYTSDYLKDFTDDVEKVRAAREAYVYRQLESGKLPAKPYAKEVLKEIKSRGFVTGLATSTARVRSTDVLTALGLFSYIDFPVYSDDVKMAKPYPDLYLEALRRAGFPPEQSLAVEDSLTGAEAARRAGVSVVLVPDRSFQPDGGQMPGELPDNVVTVGRDLRRVLEFLQE